MGISSKDFMDMQRRVKDKSKKAIQGSLFENDVVIPESVKKSYVELEDAYEIELEIMGKNPIPKQADRSTILPQGKGLGQRIDGALHYKIKDLWINHYQTDVINKERDRIRARIVSQLYDGFEPYTKQVEVLFLDFIFSPLTTMTKKEKDMIDNGVIIPKTTTPDTDNLEKMLWDSLQDIIFTNDSRIWKKNNIRKYYGSIPGIKVKLRGI